MKLKAIYLSGNYCGRKYVEIEVWDRDEENCCVLSCEVEGNPDDYDHEANVAAAKEICHRINQMEEI